ncbi:hypothetical protein HDU88_007880 [Geranomyces variabilis]|nr:hypothetical protein HDU88_007880 [Geranomyces variabilis]
MPSEGAEDGPISGHPMVFREIRGSDCLVNYIPISAGRFTLTKGLGLVKRLTSFHSVHRLSRLVYPPELFRLMRAGSNIDSLINGILLHQGVHHLSFGVLWWIEHEGTTYRVHNPGKTRFVTDQATLSFNNPAPNPTLINIHACMAQTRRNLTLLKLWKAAGERSDLFDDDAPFESGGPATEAWDDVPPLIL